MRAPLVFRLLLLAALPAAGWLATSVLPEVELGDSARGGVGRGGRGGPRRSAHSLPPAAPLGSGCAGCLAPRPECQQVQTFLGRGRGALAIAPTGGSSGPLGRLWGPPISSPRNPEDAKPVLTDFFPTLVFPELKEVTRWQSSEVLENTPCTRAALFCYVWLGGHTW